LDYLVVSSAADISSADAVRIATRPTTGNISLKARRAETDSGDAL